MPLPPVSARVANELLLKRVDKEWVFHKLPTDDIYIPPKQIPEPDAELNYLLEADEKWQERRPAAFCMDHRHGEDYAVQQN